MQTHVMPIHAHQGEISACQILKLSKIDHYMTSFYHVNSVGINFFVNNGTFSFYHAKILIGNDQKFDTYQYHASSISRVPLVV